MLGRKRQVTKNLVKVLEKIIMTTLSAIEKSVPIRNHEKSGLCVSCRKALFQRKSDQPVVSYM